MDMLPHSTVGLGAYGAIVTALDSLEVTATANPDHEASANIITIAQALRRAFDAERFNIAQPLSAVLIAVELDAIRKALGEPAESGAR